MITTIMERLDLNTFLELTQVLGPDHNIRPSIRGESGQKDPGRSLEGGRASPSVPGGVIEDSSRRFRICMAKGGRGSARPSYGRPKLTLISREKKSPWVVLEKLGRPQF